MNTTHGSRANFEEIDGEHRIQVGLIDAVDDAVRQGRDEAEIDEILGQLLDYSKVHFLSEQLLMRLHAYPQFDDHVQDHERMVQAMEDLQQAHEGNSPIYTLEAVESLRGLLVTHIAGRDEDLAQYLSKDAHRNDETPAGC